MKNARLAGGLVAIGIGLVTIGIGQYSSQSHAMVALPGDGVEHYPWAWNSDEEIYFTQVQPSDSAPLITAMLDAAPVTGHPRFFASALLGGQVTEFQITLGTVSISGGDFTFPAGSTILGGEPETVSLQGMHAQVQGHAGLHVQNTEDIDALTKRIEKLEAIIESLPECACASDVNRDGLVNGADLAVLLGDWGPGTP
jgi:hypothetical protein